MKKKVFTIPNILSMFRIILIPFIVWAFFAFRGNIPAIALMLVSGLTDIVDGYIARRYDMVSDLGKILDPIADKLTQCAVLVCLAIKTVPVRWLLGLMVLKELALGIVGLCTVKRTGVVTGAFWHGKASTVTLYTVMLLHMLFPEMPEYSSAILVSVSAIMMLLSLVLYIREDVSIMKDHKAEE